MASTVSYQQPRYPVGTQPENVSSIEKHKQTLNKLLSEDMIARVKELGKDTFDPMLWALLSSTGTAKYHWIVAKEELQPGYFWIQEDMMVGSSILWSTPSGWIYRAYPSSEKEDRIVVETFMSNGMSVQAKSQEMSIEDFQNLAKGYLSKYANPREAVCQSQFAREFQRKLEHLPIVFKITQSACAKLAELREKYRSSFLDVSVVLGVNGKEGEKFDPEEWRGVQLVEISKYFINGRLPFLHDVEGKPEVTTEPVAPVIRTMEAFKQTLKLRKMVEEGRDDPREIIRLDPERSVQRIRSDDEIVGKSLKDLHAWFILVPGGICREPHEFEVLEPGTSDEESLELHINFQEETWKLQSRFFEKI